MQNRPIHTLAEDFQFVGLTQDEMEQPEPGAKPDPQKLRMQKMANAATAKAAVAKKKMMKAGYSEDEAQEAIDAISEDDFDLIPEADELEAMDDGDVLDEFQMAKINVNRKGPGGKVIKKKSKQERMQAAKKSRTYRKGKGKSQAKRYRKSSRFKKLKKLYAKAKKSGKKAKHGVRRMFSKMLGASAEHQGNDLSELGSIIGALEHTEDSSQFAAAYADIAQLSTGVAKELRSLDESYVDINYPLDEAADHCDWIAEEARSFLGALQERDGSISVEDQRLLESHLGELRSEALAMANYWDDTEILISLDEGRMPTIEGTTEESYWLMGDEDEDLEEDLFYEDEDEDEDSDEDAFDGLRGEVALMFGIRQR